MSLGVMWFGCWSICPTGGWVIWHVLRILVSLCEWHFATIFRTSACVSRPIYGSYERLHKGKWKEWFRPYVSTLCVSFPCIQYYSKWFNEYEKGSTGKCFDWFHYNNYRKVWCIDDSSKNIHDYEKYDFCDAMFIYLILPYDDIAKLCI